MCRESIIGHNEGIKYRRRKGRRISIDWLRSRIWAWWYPGASKLPGIDHVASIQGRGQDWIPINAPIIRRGSISDYGTGGSITHLNCDARDQTVYGNYAPTGIDVVAHLRRWEGGGHPWHDHRGRRLAIDSVDGLSCCNHIPCVQGGG